MALVLSYHKAQNVRLENRVVFERVRIFVLGRFPLFFLQSLQAQGQVARVQHWPTEHEFKTVKERTSAAGRHLSPRPKHTFKHQSAGRARSPEAAVAGGVAPRIYRTERARSRKREQWSSRSGSGRRSARVGTDRLR